MTLDEIKDTLLTTDGRGLAAKQMALKQLFDQIECLQAVRRSNQRHMDEQDGIITAMHLALFTAQAGLGSIHGDKFATLFPSIVKAIKMRVPVVAPPPTPPRPSPLAPRPTNFLPHITPICKKCHLVMKPSQALEQTWTAGLPDFIGDTNPSLQTMSPGGPGKLIPCMKCPGCGFSTT